MTRTVSSNKIRSKRRRNSFIDILNMIVLLIYPALISYEFRRYIAKDTGSSYITMFLILEGALLITSLIKIILYFTRVPAFSLLSILMLAGSVYFHLYKFDFEWRFFLTNMPVLFTLSVMMISMYRIPFDKIVKVYLITNGTLFIIRIAGAVTHVLPSERYNIGSRTDIWDLGFGHYNTPLMYFFFICVAWIYLVRNRKNYTFHAISIGALTVILYKITTSRTAPIVLILGVIALLAFSILELNAFKSLKKPLLAIYRILMVMMPMALAVISFGGTLILNYFIYHNGMPKHWSTLYERFVNFNDDCALNGVHLPWSCYADAEFQSLKYNWIVGGQSQSDYSDNLIQTLLISYGVVILVVYLLLMTIWAVKSYKKKNDINLLIIGLISVLSAMQPHASLYGWNPFLMLPFAIWGASEQELTKEYLENRIPFKDSIREFVKKLTFRKKQIIPLLIVYLIVSMGFMAIVAYQLITNVVSDYFFWWMFVTVYLLLVVDIIVNKPIKANSKAYADSEELSLKSSFKTYAPRIIIMAIIFMIGVAGIMYKILNTEEFELDTHDIKLAGEGLELSGEYRQAFKLTNSGLKKISIYLADYSEDVSEFGFSFVSTNGLNGTASVITPSEYEENGVIEIDTSNGSFKTGDTCVFSMYDINEGKKLDPIIKKVAYTFVSDVDFVGCALIGVPVLILMAIVWVVGALRNRNKA